MSFSLQRLCGQRDDHAQSDRKQCASDEISTAPHSRLDFFSPVAARIVSSHLHGTKLILNRARFHFMPRLELRIFEAQLLMRFSS